MVISFLIVPELPLVFDLTYDLLVVDWYVGWPSQSKNDLTNILEALFVEIIIIDLLNIVDQAVLRVISSSAI